MTRCQFIVRAFADARNDSEWRNAAAAARRYGQTGAMLDPERADLLLAASEAAARIWQYAVGLGRKAPALSPGELFDRDPWGER